MLPAVRNEVASAHTREVGRGTGPLTKNRNGRDARWVDGLRHWHDTPIDLAGERSVVFLTPLTDWAALWRW